MLIRGKGRGLSPGVLLGLRITSNVRETEQWVQIPAATYFSNTDNITVAMMDPRVQRAS